MAHQIVRTGVDLVEISRVDDIIQRYGKKFLDRIYTPAELACCGGRSQSLAARFAAKEAVAKALGEGIGKVCWQEIEVLRDDFGAPVLKLHGAAKEKAEALALNAWSLSVSHTRDQAIAMVVALGSAQ